MTKTIEDWRPGLQEIFLKSVNEFSKKMAECKEEIMIAFMAKYGLQPDQCVLIYQENKFWIEKKKPPEHDE